MEVDSCDFLTKILFSFHSFSITMGITTSSWKSKKLLKLMQSLRISLLIIICHYLLLICLLRKSLILRIIMQLFLNYLIKSDHFASHLSLNFFLFCIEFQNLVFEIINLDFGFLDFTTIDPNFHKSVTISSALQSSKSFFFSLNFLSV